ncbi:hypothetical protein [Bacillus velezensis]|uniref:hypothetical protein n=1 Tax=Bacillus velezensis TaxID=492670 RepID=UPI002FBEC42C
MLKSLIKKVIFGIVPWYFGEFEAVKTDSLPAAIKDRFKENKSNKNKADSY